MKKVDAVVEFETDVLRKLKRSENMDGHPDYPARRVAWNNYVDALQKAGHITEKKAATWTQPRSCYSKTEWDQYIAGLKR